MQIRCLNSSQSRALSSEPTDKRPKKRSISFLNSAVWLRMTDARVLTRNDAFMNAGCIVDGLEVALFPPGRGMNLRSRPCTNQWINHSTNRRHRRDNSDPNVQGQASCRMQTAGRGQQGDSSPIPSSLSLNAAFCGVTCAPRDRYGSHNLRRFN